MVSAPKAGDILAGKYRVEKTIGEGGMGVVVEATHVTLDQRVALKYLQPSLANEPDMAARFLREARNAVRLTSEHVARVFDVGTLESGAPYMVMEFLEGHDLGRVLDDNGPMPIAAAVDATVQAIDAIAEAHDLGIVHRDLKPQNLFLTRRGGRNGFVKVLDFGISKAMDQNEERPLTKTRALLGSPAYMAPEQMRSARTVDARADIWALGIILYELLTARVPFFSESLPEQCLMVTQDPLPSIVERRADIPPGLAKVIEKCLEKDPAARFANVRELAAALEPYRNVKPAPAPMPAAVTRPQGSRFHPAPKLLRMKLDSTQPAAPAPGTIEAAPIDPAALAPSAVPSFAGVERIDAPPLPARPPRARAIAMGAAMLVVAASVIFVIARPSSTTSPTPAASPAPPPAASEPPAAPEPPSPPEPPAVAEPMPAATASAATSVAPAAKPKPAAATPAKTTVDAGVKPASEHRTTW